MVRLISIATIVAFVFINDADNAKLAEACGVKLTVKAKPPKAKRSKSKRKLVGAKSSEDPKRRKVKTRTTRAPVRAGPKARPTRQARASGTATARSPSKVKPAPAVAKTQSPVAKPVAETVEESPQPKRRVVRARTEEPKVAAAESTRKAAAKKSTRRRKRATVPELSVEVHFDLGSADASDAELDEVTEWLAENPRGWIVLEGHTDKSGSAGFNLWLSRRRASAVKRAILARTDNASARRILIRASGESRIAYPDDPGKNRRVLVRSR